MRSALPDYRLFAGERLLPVDRVAPCETCPPKSGAACRDADAVLVWEGEGGAGTTHRLCRACLDVRYGASEVTDA